MNKPWIAEFDVKAETARRLIQLQFPQLKIDHLEELGEGFDNTVFMVNRDYVFRFPKRQVSVDLLRVENSLLPELVSQVPLSIPAPQFIGHPSEAYPFPFTGYKLLKGKVPGKIPMESRLSSAPHFARFLKALHSFPVKRAESLGVEPDRLNRINVNVRVPMFRKRIEQLEQLGFSREAKLAAACLHSLSGCSDTGIKNVLVHGDIHIRNVIVNNEGQLTGVIDWGDVHIGNPAIDISFIYSFLPKSGRKLFYTIYGTVDEETKNLARFKSVYTTVMLFLYGIDRKDESLIASAKTSLELALK
ncbi:phosphotransferase [Peribacillus sp. SCS-155]|uniref:phosphotransferase n=1 Tax=Peribacillus sedimenti TaxID=3115297 RepID=UPI003905CE07